MSVKNENNMVSELLKNTKKNLYGIFLYLPSESMERFRAFFYRSIGIKIGNDVRISVGAILDVWHQHIPFCLGSHISVGRNSLISGGVKVGSGTFFNSNVSVIASPPNTIEIGENCLIAQNVLIRSDDHVFDDIQSTINMQGRRGVNLPLFCQPWLVDWVGS